MVFLMRNLLKSKKAQFFVLSAFSIVAIIFYVNQWTSPYIIVDTSSAILQQEPFVMNNIAEKSRAAVNSSLDCNDLNLNLDEYKNFVEKYAVSKNLKLQFKYTVFAPCSDSVLLTNFDISLSSANSFFSANFNASKLT